MNKLNTILFLLCILFFSIVFSKFEIINRENFGNKKKNIVFLGDSVLKNNMYVDKNKTVEYYVEKIDDANVANLAVDSSNIVDVHNQVKKLPVNSNGLDTYIFLSIGGNDIMNNFVYNEGTPISYLDKLFDNYRHLVDSILTKMDKSKLILLSVYNPEDKNLSKYKNIIDKWNEKLDTYTEKEGILYLDLRPIFNSKRDFAVDVMSDYYIEPSAYGGEKLAHKIVEIVHTM